MGKLVHKLLNEYKKDPEGVEAAMNSHINNVVGSYTAGARAAGMEFGIHCFETYPPDEAMTMLKKQCADWTKLANQRKKS